MHLKPEYKESKQNVDDKTVVISQNTSEIKISSLLYSNNVVSDKVINIMITKGSILSFIKELSNRLFSKSTVNIYNNLPESSNDISTINIYDSEFISEEYSLLSVSSKKHILTKLYNYADFDTN